MFVAVMAAALAVSLASGAVRQTSRANTVDVTVAVLDGVLGTVPNLSAGDFDVRIDDAPVAVVGIMQVPAELSIVLIFDGTSSQPLKRYEVVNAVTTQWMPGLMAGDRIRVGMIAAPLSLLDWMSRDARAAAPTIKAFFDRAPLEPSPLWDATAAAVDALAGEKGTKLVLLMSDGRANANATGLEDAAARALAGGVAVTVVGESAESLLAQAGDPAARIRPHESLMWLARETGGMYLPDGVARRSLRPQQDPFAYVRELVATPNRPGPLLVSLTNAMRQRYRLTIAGPTDGREHRIEVRALTPGTTTHWARRLR